MDSSREPQEWWSTIAATAPSTTSPSPSDDDGASDAEAQQLQQASSTSARSTPPSLALPFSTSALLWATRSFFACAAVSGGVMLVNYLRGQRVADGAPPSPSTDSASSADLTSAATAAPHPVSSIQVLSHHCAVQLRPF